MALTLRYHRPTHLAVDMAAVGPRVGNSLGELQRAPVRVGNELVSLGELFELSGDPSDARWELEGDFSRVHYLGAGMSAGTLHIRGDVGRHVGAAMHGGSIVVEGSAGDWVGAEMLGGSICVAGSAGDWVGSALTGSKVGMRGGSIRIYGGVGRAVAQRMRRGWIAIGGKCGPYAAYRMRAGSLLLFDECGEHPGLGMRRGTLALLGPPPTPMAARFKYACRYRPQALQLMLATLHREGFPAASEAMPGEVDLFHGDLLEGGRSELWMTPQ